MNSLFNRSSRTMTAEQWNTYQAERRDRLVRKMHKILGGRCAECGTSDDLQLHHKNRDEKSFDPTRCNRAWSAILLELEKCELRCGPCHRRHHYAKHGTVTRYRNHGCRCDACVAVYKPWKAALERRYYQRVRNDPDKLKQRRQQNAAARRKYRARQRAKQTSWFAAVIPV